MNRYDICWEFGVYDDDCICDFCSHREECSGREEKEEEE